MGLGGLFTLIFLVWFGTALLIAGDAQERGHNYGAWFFGILLTGIFGVIVYLVVRSEKADEPFTYSNKANPSDQSFTELYKSTCSFVNRVDAENWDYIIKVGVLIWALEFFLPIDLILGNLSRNLFGLALFITWFLLPLAIFMDCKHTRSSTNWNPNQKGYSVISIIPLINFLVGGFYLVRRHYALKERDFTSSTVQEDLGNGYNRIRNLVKKGR